MSKKKQNDMIIRKEKPVESEKNVKMRQRFRLIRRPADQGWVALGFHLPHQRKDGGMLRAAQHFAQAGHDQASSFRKGAQAGS